jgi:heme/copper-type cytochrome/quinol oxidase subunit 2
MGLMLLIIILVIVAYFNAKKEASDCDPKELNSEKSEKSSMGTTPIIFIVFIAITFLAVSTMNLTYKVNYFTKKVDKPEITNSSATETEQSNQ